MIDAAVSGPATSWLSSSAIVQLRSIPAKCATILFVVHSFVCVCLVDCFFGPSTTLKEYKVSKNDQQQQQQHQQQKKLFIRLSRKKKL